MSILSRGRQIGVAVRNASRLQEIIRVFAKHGFGDVWTRVGLGRFLPSKFQTALESKIDLAPEDRIRMAFEELGPTFIKLGQLVAARPDLIPEPYITALSSLQDNVRAQGFESIRALIEQELECPIESVFSSVEEIPLAAASIAQVHAARLLDGTDVVIKVQRPGIERAIFHDIDLMDFLAGLLEKYVPESQVFSPKLIVDEFFRTLKFELDFNIEANNIRRISENLKEFHSIKIPRVYREFSSQRVITMERFYGRSLREIMLSKKIPPELKALNEEGARAFFKTVMIDGVFHGDLHGGNLFYLNDGSLGIIDFGIVGRLSSRSRQQLSNMLVALVDEDFESLCYQYADLGGADASMDMDGFQREVQNFLGPYIGLKANEVNSGRVLMDVTRIATRYQIRVPGDWMIVFKSLYTAEGIGRALDPDFDMVELGRVLAKDLVQHQFSKEKVAKDLLWAGKDLLALARILPRQLHWLLRKWSQDGFAFELRWTHWEEAIEVYSKQAKKSRRALITGFLSIATAIALHLPESSPAFLGYPVAAWLLGALALWGYLKS